MVLGTWLPDHEAHFSAPYSTNQADVCGISFSPITCGGGVCTTLCVCACTRTCWQVHSQPLSCLLMVYFYLMSKACRVSMEKAIPQACRTARV